MEKSSLTVVEVFESELRDKNTPMMVMPEATSIAQHSWKWLRTPRVV